MIDLAQVQSVVEAWNKPQQYGEHVVVPTFSTYPSNSLVQAYVTGGRDTFIVSDGGGALQTLLGAGAPSGVMAKLLSDFAKSNPIKVNSSGWIYVDKVALGGLTSAISTVSEASLLAADFLLNRFRPVPVEDFRRDLDVMLRDTFLSSLHKRGHVLGASNKLHTFDYLVEANDNSLTILDAVVPDSSSINAAVVAHMDVRATNRPNVRQFIVYNDLDRWSSSDLALLAIGAPTIAYSKFSPSIMDRRLV